MLAGRGAVAGPAVGWAEVPEAVLAARRLAPLAQLRPAQREVLLTTLHSWPPATPAGGIRYVTPCCASTHRG
jgi:hypothetical protein